MKWHLAIAFGLVAGIFGVYFQVVDHEFVNYDDLMYLSRLQFELDSESIRRAFTEPFQVNWIPLTWISMLIDHSLYGDDPTGYLLTNVALHAVAAVLLYAAFARMTKAIWPSAFVAAVFAIHPLHVESVAWMSARKDVLSGVSFAFTLLTYARYAERPTPLRYALVAIGVLFALMSKPSVVTLPFVLLLLDYWPLGRLRADPARRLPDAMLLRRAVLEKLPLFVAVAAVATATLLAQRSAEIGVSDDLFSLGTRIANGFVSYAAYVRQGFWPSRLAAFYPHPGETISSAHAAGAALLLAGVTAFAMRLANTRPYLAVGWFWFLGMLIPMIGFVQVGIQARADRYMYLPLIGLTLAVAFAAAQGLAHRRVGRAVFAVAAGVVVLALGAVGFVQVGYWRDTTALFERAIAVTENNAFAHSSLGAAYQDSKRFEDAELQLEKAVSLRPDWAVPRIRLADLLAEQQRWEEAVPHYQRGIEDQPGNAHLRINLGQILIRLQRYGEARVELERGEKQWDQLDPVERYSLHQGLARADWEEGYFGSAIRHYQSAVQLRPNHPVANTNLGVLLARIGRMDAAGIHLMVAVSHAGPGSTEALVARAALVSAARPREAVRLYRAALRRNQDLTFARDHLAWILATSPDTELRDPETAIRLAETALREGVIHPVRLDTLAAAYAAAGRFPEAVDAEERAGGGPVAGKFADAIRDRRALYEAGIAYVEQSPRAGAPPDAPDS